MLPPSSVVRKLSVPLSILFLLRYDSLNHSPMVRTFRLNLAKHIHPAIRGSFSHRPVILKRKIFCGTTARKERGSAAMQHGVDAVTAGRTLSDFQTPTRLMARSAWDLSDHPCSLLYLRRPVLVRNSDLVMTPFPFR